MNLATLRLFKAIQIDKREGKNPDRQSLEATIPFGYVLDGDIKSNRGLVKSINDLVGLSGEQANATFHKSWEKVRSAKIEQLVLEQALHYITTYGFASAGIYDPSTVYIPHEKLELPALTEDIPLTYIRGLTADEVLTEIIKLGSGIALQEQSLDDILSIVKANKFEPDFLAQIENHELMARLCDFYGVTPEEPVAFLRYVVFKLTDSSLLIKNDELINSIKELKPKSQRLLDKLIAKAPEDLASVFYRFKPIFLALKSLSKNKGFFNRLRKAAVKLHKPLPTDYMNSVTEQLKRCTLDHEELRQRLQSTKVFRKVRLAYALHFRLNAGESIVYPVRNGRGWATDFSWPKELLEPTATALDIVLSSLVGDIAPNVRGKSCYIPDYINYAVPSSEKLFAGPYPVGSYVTTPGDTVFGIHWFNAKDRSIDLDLSLLSAEGKVGWDAQYRNEEALFSGDITDAPRPRGATELFYAKNGIAPNLVMCNYFNFSPAHPVETKIIVAKEAPKKLKSNYMVDPNKIVAKADVAISRTQSILGLVLTVKGETRFYFGNVGVGCGITADDQPHTQHARDYLTDRFTNCLDLKSLLVSADAVVADERPTEGDYIDLSPECLDKSSILSLFQADKKREAAA